MKKIISLICLIVCTLIWGTTFIAQDTGMDNIGPFTFNSVRFFVGFLAVAPFFFWFEKKKIKQKIKNRKNEFFKLIVPVGFFLFLGCIFQQVSLLYTDVANSAFFTIFYVPLVPIIVNFLFSEKLHWSIWPSVLACVIGGYFLSDISNPTIRFGDGLVLIGALFWALHIIYIGKIIVRFDLPFFIALIQNLVVATLSFILVIMFDDQIRNSRNFICRYFIRRSSFCFATFWTKKYFCSSCCNCNVTGGSYCFNCSLDYFKSIFRY